MCIGMEVIKPHKDEFELSDFFEAALFLHQYLFDISDFPLKAARFHI
jgi:hypothetical protein